MVKPRAKWLRAAADCCSHAANSLPPKLPHHSGNCGAQRDQHAQRHGIAFRDDDAHSDAYGDGDIYPYANPAPDEHPGNAPGAVFGWRNNN